MSAVPVEAGTCNRETLQSLILELKALQKSNCGYHPCQDTTLQKGKRKCRRWEDKFKPPAVRENTSVLTVSLLKQTGGAPLFPSSCKTSMGIGRTSDTFEFQNTRYSVKWRSRNFSKQNILYVLKRSRSVSDSITGPSKARCMNASKPYYGLSCSFMISYMRVVLFT